MRFLQDGLAMRRNGASYEEAARAVLADDERLMREVAVDLLASAFGLAVTLFWASRSPQPVIATIMMERPHDSCRMRSHTS